MSGGALDHIHIRLQDTAETLCRLAAGRNDPDQVRAFAGAVQHFAEVLRAIDYDICGDESLSESMYQAMDMYTKAAKPMHDPRINGSDSEPTSPNSPPSPHFL